MIKREKVSQEILHIRVVTENLFTKKQMGKTETIMKCLHLITGEWKIRNITLNDLLNYTW